MKMKEPQQKQHKDQSADNEIHGAVDRLTQLKTVWNQMKSGNAEHETCDEAHHQLRLRVCELITTRKPPAQPRGYEQRNAITQNHCHKGTLLPHCDEVIAVYQLFLTAEAEYCFDVCRGPTQ